MLSALRAMSLIAVVRCQLVNLYRRVVAAGTMALYREGRFHTREITRVLGLSIRYSVALRRKNNLKGMLVSKAYD